MKRQTPSRTEGARRATVRDDQEFRRDECVTSRAKPSVGTSARPPSYMSRKELAWELSCSESTIDVLVRTGVIPPPVKLTSGMVRWWWPAVQERLASLSVEADDGDPYMSGAANVTA